MTNNSEPDAKTLPSTTIQDEDKQELSLEITGETPSLYRANYESFIETLRNIKNKVLRSRVSDSETVQQYTTSALEEAMNSGRSKVRAPQLKEGKAQADIEKTAAETDKLRAEIEKLRAETRLINAQAAKEEAARVIEVEATSDTCDGLTNESLTPPSAEQVQEALLEQAMERIYRRAKNGEISIIDVGGEIKIVVN